MPPRRARTPVPGGMFKLLDLPAVMKGLPAPMRRLPSDPPASAVSDSSITLDDDAGPVRSSIITAAPTTAGGKGGTAPLSVSISGGSQSHRAERDPRVTEALRSLPHSPHELRYAIAVIPPKPAQRTAGSIEREREKQAAAAERARKQAVAREKTCRVRFDDDDTAAVEVTDDAVSQGDSQDEQGPPKDAWNRPPKNKPSAIRIRPRVAPPDNYGGPNSPASPYGGASPSYTGKAKRFSIAYPSSPSAAGSSPRSPRQSIAGFTPATRVLRHALAAARRQRSRPPRPGSSESNASGGSDFGNAGFGAVNSWYSKRKIKIRERDDRMRQQRADEATHLSSLQDAYNMKHEQTAQATALKARVQFQL